MTAFVWVDAWQQQCCGDSFAVGSHVDWEVVPEPELHPWTNELLGEEWGRRVGFSERHHGYGDEVGTRICGTVKSIQAVVSARELRRDENLGEAMFPVRGSARLHDVEIADAWEFEQAGDRSVAFDGWIVELLLAAPSVRRHGRRGPSAAVPPAGFEPATPDP